MLFTSYVKLRLAHAPGMQGTFIPPQRVCDPDMHQGTCVTHVPWCMLGSLTSGFLWIRWRGKRSRHSQPMRNAQFDLSGKRSTEYWMSESKTNSGHGMTLISNKTFYHKSRICEFYVYKFSVAKKIWPATRLPNCKGTCIFHHPIPQVRDLTRSYGKGFIKNRNEALYLFAFVFAVSGDSVWGIMKWVAQYIYWTLTVPRYWKDIQ